MNFEEARLSINSENEKEEAVKTIKSFLNKINDDLYMIKMNGYDTEDAYAVYDTLRYDILTKEKIESFYDLGKSSEFIKTINICSSLLDELVSEIENNKENSNSSESLKSFLTLTAVTTIIARDNIDLYFVPLFLLVSIVITNLTIIMIKSSSIYINLDNYKNMIIFLAQNKQLLKQELNKIQSDEKERQKSEKIINTFYSRIDKVILSIVDMLAENENKKIYNENIEEFKPEIANQPLTDGISNISKVLTEEIAKIDTSDEKDVNKLLHSIKISDSVLFEQKDDHLVIRNIFIPLLHLLDLSGVNFDNVDVRYLDFSKTNAVISIRNVYKMDISFSTFCDENILDWTDYTGVNITGTKLGENPSTMINVEGAIDNSTITVIE